MFLSIFAFILMGYMSEQQSSVIVDATPEDSIIVEIDTIPLNYYVENGIARDSLIIYNGTVKANQSLSEILLKFNVSYAEIDRIAKRSKGIFDVRKFVTGKDYLIFYTDDSLQKVECFIYEIDAANYVVYDLSDSLKIYRDRKEVEVRVRIVSGVINSSLWQTIVDNDIDYNLPLELSEIYAWAIDFYRIQKGDNFKVIYEEKYVDDKKIGMGKVISAYFNHFGDDYYAIYFEQGDAADYFDENAKSLRRAFLKAPLKYSRISSKFSRRRFHPVQKRYKPHLGTDYAAPKGTPIMTTGDGSIVAAGYSRGNGNFVKVKHNSVYSTQYLHMSKIKSGIRKGTRVRQGDVIGYVGSTGLATGPHVCYRFWKNGAQVDALRVSVPPSLPVDKSYMGAYEKVKLEMMGKLDSIADPS